MSTPKNRVMHSNMSPHTSALSRMYILTRSLLVQVWSMKIQIKEQSKTKKKIFERISGGLTDLFIRTNLECTFVHFCIFLFILFKFFDKDGIIFFFRHFRDVKIFVNIRA